MIGYGIYFMIIEILREQTDFTYPLSDIDLIADEIGTSEEKVKAVIKGYDLFKFNEDENFFSVKLIMFLQQNYTYIIYLLFFLLNF